MSYFLAVTGTYGPEPKESKIGQAIVGTLNDYLLPLVQTKHLAGGTVETLENTLQWLADEPVKPAVILWMPNISNDEEKFLPRIKAIAPHALLISSKRVVEKDYSHQDVVGRLLKSRSALGIMITKGLVDRYDGAGPTDHYLFEIVDPLGNVFGSKTHHADVAAMTLARRINQLRSRTRVGSTQVGEQYGLPPVSENFISVVRAYGEAFHDHLMAVNPMRFLGNASTRCMSGFPAERQHGEPGSGPRADRIFVSRRNIDKADIGPEGFVEVCGIDPDHDPDGPQTVEYYGSHKPSVDAPIQIHLFHRYPGVRYMIHGHTYMAGAPYTESVLPCGSIEEVDEITRMFPDFSETKFIVNLRGHGFLILSDTIGFLVDSMARMKTRPVPEVQEV